MHIWGENLALGSAFFLGLALLLALTFEMVNGFHDTANAVATVIYTHTLRPWVAVIWSGICNLLGVLHSSGAVAYGIVALLPTELVVNIGSGSGFAMLFSLLVSAIIWNLGTWYLGLPASSSHSLIGSIMGVALANSAFSHGYSFGEGVNWKQAKDVALSLVVSPAVGFIGAALLFWLLKAMIKNPRFFQPADPKSPPPLGVRAVLFLTCTGVSFAHGSNDGQKGMGLLMLILIGVVPGAFALKMHADHNQVAQLVSEAKTVSALFRKHQQASAAEPAAQASGDVTAFIKADHPKSDRIYGALFVLNEDIVHKFDGKDNLATIPSADRKVVRSELYLVDTAIDKLAKGSPQLDPSEKDGFAKYHSEIDHLTKYIAPWVKVAVAIALGLGTMVGWRRIVVTVGEKIGKSHLSYAQGASAEIIAMSTISLADHFGLPVSTTHVLSSGIAGAMAANHSGLQKQTLRNLVLAWVLTLPVCMLLGAGLFSAALYFIFHQSGVK